MPTTLWGGVLFSVTPTIVVGLIFWFTVRALLRSDRTERETYAKIEAEERARVEADERRTSSSTDASRAS
ncbi:hypothetical protein ACPEEZ_00480 [Frigoribacterium sp. 2-23]|uniref:hypothetical protein n=1 Tax=Frigoribacterium sp. 2-23 TaxID=3415006 RepID=UPI003C6EBA0C